jgi:hypothetical protein
MLDAGRKKKNKYRIRFDDILNAWSQTDYKSKRLIDDIKRSFEYRNWLAHGRYWVLKSGQKYDYGTIYTIAANAVTLLNKT